jgi:hypothetical protein
MVDADRLTGLKITGTVLTLVSALDEFKGAWKAIGRIAPERLSALRRVATIESAASSTQIAGAKLTDREVERENRGARIHQRAARPSVSDRGVETNEQVGYGFIGPATI